MRVRRYWGNEKRMTKTSSRGDSPVLEVSRRRLLGYGVASTLVSSVPVLAAAAPNRRLHVYDERFAAAVASAQTAADRGVPTRAIKDDMTELIFSADSPWNANSHTKVSGLTTGSALQCLAIMIRFKGWTVVHNEIVPGSPTLAMWTIARTAKGLNV